MKNTFFIILVLCWGAVFSQESDCSFGLVLSSQQAQQGESVTIDVTTRQYNNISGIQYAHYWNPAELQFEEIVFNDQLQINSSSFNLSEENLASGVLKFLFLDTALGGSLPDATTLYSLRFTYLQAGETTVRTANSGIPVEIVNEYLETIEDYYFIHATISESAPPLAAFDNACLVPESCGNSSSGSINIEIPNAETLSFAWGNSLGFESSDEDISSLGSAAYSLSIASDEHLPVYGDFYLLSNSSNLLVSLVADPDECGVGADGSISTTVPNGSGDYSFLWSNGETTMNLDNLLPGFYSLTVTDNQDGCTGSSEIEVESSSTFWITHQSIPASCPNAADGSINLSVDAPASYAPFSFLWSDGSTDEDLVNITEGLYSVIITASNGCTHQYYVALEGGTFDIPASIVHANCETSNSGSITLDLNENDFNFLWSTGETSAAINNLSVGNYELSLTNNSTGCTFQESYIIEPLNLNLAYSVLCDPIPKLSVLVWEEDAPYTFDWSDGQQTTGETVSTIDVVDNTLYAVTVTGASGCVAELNNMVVSCSQDTYDLSLSPQNSSAANGESICLDIVVDDFVSQTGFQFSLQWDESLLAFNQVGNFGLSSLGEEDFGTTLLDDGYMVVSWLSDNVGVGDNLASGSTLLNICFDVTSTTQTNTTVAIGDFPLEVEMINLVEGLEVVHTRDAQIALNGGGSGTDGVLELGIDQVSAYQNELVCVPVKSQGFTNIQGLQFSMAWNPDALVFNSIQNINIPGVDEGIQFNTEAEMTSDGILRFIWLSNSPSGESVATNETLFEVCYTTENTPGVYPISFTQSPVPLEAVNSDAEEVEILTTSGSVEILEEITGSSSGLTIASAAVHPGESICLPVLVNQFPQLVAMQFSIQWDGNLLDFDHLDLASNPLNLNETNYNLTETGDALSLLWIDPALNDITLAEGSILFEICFNALSEEGTSAVYFSDLPTVQEAVSANGNIAPFENTGGQVDINSEGLVWPGDTDTNAQVDHFDLLNIGIAFGAEGSARTNSSISWLPQAAQEWDNQTPFSAINYRHIDTDGSGLIDEQDVFALEQNWGETTDGFTETTEDFRELSLITVPFYVTPDTVEANTQVLLPIMLGTEETSVEDAYGIAFTIYYDPDLVRPGSAHVQFEGWMGHADDDLIGVFKDQHSEGKIDIALVRTNGENVSGDGQIASFGIIMEDVVFRDLVDLELALRIENVRLINVSEDILPTSPRESIILVENITNTEQITALQALQIHPNPVRDYLNILHPGIEIQTVRVLSPNGQVLSNMENIDQQLNLSHLPTGLYLVEIQTDQGITYRKLVKS